MAVLEVGELLEEHHRRRGAVAVDERDGAARLDLEHGRHDREHRRDAAARGEGAVVLGVGRVERGEEAAGRGHDVDHVADAQRARRVAGERAAREPLDADAQPPARRRRADRVVAAHLLAVDDRAHREVLARHEGVGVAQVVGHLEGDRDRVVGQPLDRPRRAAGGTCRAGGRRAPRRCRWSSTQIALKWSKGSRHVLHRHSDLQAVEPNRLSSWVSGLPHCGQRTERATGTGPDPCARPRADGRRDAVGLELAAPSSLIQSVVHAGREHAAHLHLLEAGAAARPSRRRAR